MDKAKTPAEIAASQTLDQIEAKRVENAKKAEATLQQLAAEKKRAYEDRPDVKIRFLKTVLAELKNDVIDTEESVRFSIQDVDVRGNVQLRTGPGIPTDFSSSALVKSNYESRRERADKIREAIVVIENFVEMLKPTGSGQVPEDLPAFCADLRRNIPNRDIEEIVQSPKPVKEPKSEMAKGGGKGGE